MLLLACLWFVLNLRECAMNVCRWCAMSMPCVLERLCPNRRMFSLSLSESSSKLLYVERVALRRLAL